MLYKKTKPMRVVIILLLLACTGTACFSQQKATLDPSTLANLQQLKHKLSPSQNSRHLSYEMDYRIAAISNPSAYIDSSKGICKYLNGKCWYTISGMEVFQDTALTVVVFEEDQLIYLTKPALLQAGFNAQSLLDSLSTGNTELTCHVQNGKNGELFKILFQKPTLYKEIAFQLDKSGMLLSMSQVVNQSAMSGGVQTTGLSDDWLVLDIRFMNWKPTSLTDPVFTLSHYVQKTDEGYIPSNRLTNYTVFIAHPSL